MPDLDSDSDDDMDDLSVSRETDTSKEEHGLPLPQVTYGRRGFSSNHPEPTADWYCRTQRQPLGISSYGRPKKGYLLSAASSQVCTHGISASIVAPEEYIMAVGTHTGCSLQTVETQDSFRAGGACTGLV